MKRAAMIAGIVSAVLFLAVIMLASRSFFGPGMSGLTAMFLSGGLASLLCVGFAVRADSAGLKLIGGVLVMAYLTTLVMTSMAIGSVR